MRLPRICKDAGSLIRFKNIFKYLWDSRFLGQETVNSPVIDRFVPVHPTSEPPSLPNRSLHRGELHGSVSGVRGKELVACLTEELLQTCQALRQVLVAQGVGEA